MAKDALLRAIDLAGGQKPLADKIGTSQSNVWYWAFRSKRGVPAEWCPAIETATGVPVGELRPDIYGRRVVAEVDRLATVQEAAR